MDVFYKRVSVRKGYLTAAFFLNFICLNAQHQVLDLYYQSDPSEGVENADSVKILRREFLQNAIEVGDSLNIIFGNIHVTKDLMSAAEYDEALLCLLHAEEIAAQLSDTLLLGRIAHKKANIYVLLRDDDKSIPLFNDALAYSRIAQDNKYIAISLEQLGSRYSYIGNYELANNYYKKAMVLIEQHCSKKSLVVSLINYGCLLDYQDSTARAFSIFKKAIKIAEDEGYDYDLIPAKHNIAFMYAENNNPQKAIEIFYECKSTNELNRWPDFLMYSYKGLSNAYKIINNMDSAFYYLEQYHIIKDSVIGVQAQKKIIELEREAITSKRDLEISEQKEINFQKNISFYKLGILTLLLLTLAIMIGWNLFLKAKNASALLTENRINLKEVTKLLASKNAELKESILRNINVSQNKTAEVDSTIEDVNLFDLKILTYDDWQHFKILFEKSYPNLIFQLRQKYPDISQAEERLFLFIKISISNDEASKILGIQVDTIKKTRIRLKKRLHLHKDENLNDFVKDF